jgi:hypothetical protein
VRVDNGYLLRSKYGDDKNLGKVSVFTINIMMYEPEEMNDSFGPSGMKAWNSSSG